MRGQPPAAAGRAARRGVRTSRGGALVLLLLATALAAALLAGAAALAIDDAPAVSRPPAPSAGDIAAGLRAVRELAAGARPRSSQDDGTPAPSVVLSQRALAWAFDQVANRALPSATRVELHPGAALLRSSIALPANPFGGWLNVEALLKEGGLPPEVERLRVGRLPLPGWLGDIALRSAVGRLDERLAAGSEGAAALRVLGRTLRGVGFRSGEARIVSEWDGEARERLVAALLPPARQQRARAYHERLVQATATAGPRQSVPLARLLAPMFALARERTAAGEPPAQENRAAIQTLALYVLGTGWNAFLPHAGAWTAPRRLVVTLAGRDDFPQHWLVSAAIAAEGGGPLADAIGLYKEIEDPRRGSGFSFSDIAIDRAGTRFGVRAVEAPAEVQARMAGGVSESDLVPDVSDLPEFMSATEFARRYGAVDSPAYRRMLATIEARVAALPALR